MKKLRIASFIAALVLAAGVQTLFCACGPAEDGSFMNCHNAQTAVFCFGIILAVLSLAGLLLKSRTACAVSDAVSAILAVIALLIPGVIVHMCMMDTMQCWTHLKPFTMIVCILILIFAVLNLIAGIRTGKNKSMTK